MTDILKPVLLQLPFPEAAAQAKFGREFDCILHPPQDCAWQVTMLPTMNQAIYAEIYLLQRSPSVF